MGECRPFPQLRKDECDMAMREWRNRYMTGNADVIVKKNNIK